MNYYFLRTARIMLILCCSSSVVGWSYPTAFGYPLPSILPFPLKPLTELLFPSTISEETEDFSSSTHAQSQSNETEEERSELVKKILQKQNLLGHGYDDVQFRDILLEPREGGSKGEIVKKILTKEDYENMVKFSKSDATADTDDYGDEPACKRGLLLCYYFWKDDRIVYSVKVKCIPKN